MEEKKFTKRDMYERTKEIVASTNVEDKDALIDFIEKQIVMLDNKSEKNKERAAERRAAGDELRGVIKGVLTDSYQTADEITSLINVEGVTKAKVTARLGQLVKLGEVEKTDVKTEDGRTVKAYKLVD